MDRPAPAFRGEFPGDEVGLRRFESITTGRQQILRRRSMKPAGLVVERGCPRGGSAGEGRAVGSGRNVGLGVLLVGTGCARLGEKVEPDRSDRT